MMLCIAVSVTDRSFFFEKKSSPKKGPFVNFFMGTERA